MRRFLMTVTTVVVLLTGVIVAEAAKCTDNFTVRFRENTLVVASTKMEEARIYSLDGKLLQKERGTINVEHKRCLACGVCLDAV